MTNDIDNRDNIRDSARRLCENRVSYDFKDKFEKDIISDIDNNNGREQLVHAIISLLHGEDGNIRVGAAELLGEITPASMADMVLKELYKHLEDDFIRTYLYGGFQGDEEDTRTVAECSKLSIERLNESVAGS